MTQKMKKHFYSHIIETSTISLELADMEMSPEERLHLLSIVEDNLHHTILDAVLAELEEEDKKIFLMHLSEDKHDEIWHLLKKKINNIEDKIKNAAEELKNELYKDIKEIKS